LARSLSHARRADDHHRRGPVPKAFQEAPALAELVKAGKLPQSRSASARTARHQAADDIGKYGGTWRRGFLGPADYANASRAAANDTIVNWNTEGNAVTPQIAKSWQISPDGKTLTFQFRRA